MALTAAKKKSIDNMAYEAVEEIKNTIEEMYAQGDNSLDDISAEIGMTMEEYEYFNSIYG